MNDSRQLTVRSCSLDSGSPTASTELVRQPDYCGPFLYNQQ